MRATTTNLLGACISLLSGYHYAKTDRLWSDRPDSYMHDERVLTRIHPRTRCHTHFGMSYACTIIRVFVVAVVVGGGGSGGGGGVMYV